MADKIKRELERDLPNNLESYLRQMEREGKDTQYIRNELVPLLGGRNTASIKVYLQRLDTEKSEKSVAFFRRLLEEYRDITKKRDQELSISPKEKQERRVLLNKLLKGALESDGQQVSGRDLLEKSKKDQKGEVNSGYLVLTQLQSLLQTQKSNTSLTPLESLDSLLIFMKGVESEIEGRDLDDEEASVRVGRRVVTALIMEEMGSTFNSVEYSPEVLGVVSKMRNAFMELFTK